MKKKKISRILGVALTLVLLSSFLMVSAPVGAATQAWGTFKTPSTTGMVLNTTIASAEAFAQSPVDGALYAAVTDAGSVYKLLKSTDSGRTWKSITTTTISNAVVAIVPSPVDANVVFYVDAGTLYRSNDGGVTFLTVLNAPGATPEAFTALDIAKWGGRYFAVVGTNNADNTGGVLYWDENDISNNLVTWGSIGSTFGLPVLSLALAPTFNVDRAMVVAGVDDTPGTTVVRTNVNGGAWGAVIADVTIGSDTTADPTAADIAFPTDYNVSGLPVYFIAVSDADAGDGGVYSVIGAVLQSPLDTGLTWNNLSMDGSYASLAGSILVGSSVGTAIKSVNSGFNFSAVTLRSNTAANTAWVLFDKDYGTNNLAYVLNIGAAGGAFNVTINSMANFNQWSLVSETIATIVDLDVASNGDMFMITGTANNIWRYFGAVWERVRVGITGDIIRISEDYVNDKAVAYALVNSANAILISANNANSFTAQSTQPGSTDGTPNNVTALMLLGLNSVVVGSTGGVVTTSTVGWYWLEVTITGFGTVQSFDRDSVSGDILAGSAQSGAGKVAVSSSPSNGVSWTVALDGTTAATITDIDATLIAVFGSSYASTGEMYATGTDSGNDAGVWKRTTGSWTQIDKIAGTPTPQQGTDDVKAGVGLVSAPGVVDMVYAADGSGTGEGVYRIKSNRTEGEKLADTSSYTPRGLWYQPGSNVLYTLSGNTIRTFTDTLNVAGENVVVSAVTVGTATVTWKALDNATNYLVVVNTTAKTNFYTAGNSTNVKVAGATGNVAITGGTGETRTAAITVLAANTTYNVSVWAWNTESSFLFGGAAKSFTTLPGAIQIPPQNLIPAHGAINIPIDGPAFAWGAPTGGATSYDWQLSTDPTFASITEGSVNTTLTFLVWDGSLAYEQDYYWRVRANTNAGVGAWVTQVFTTVAEAAPPVTIPPASPAPTPTFILPTQPQATFVLPPITVIPPDVIVNLPTPVITTQPPAQIVLPEEDTPPYIWAIVAIGAILTIAVIVLIVRTRRVV